MISADFMADISGWVHTRQWDFYRFSSPIVALVVQFASKSFKKDSTGLHDRALADAGINDSAQRALFVWIAKDLDLRVSYFATAITTVFSIAAITHAFSGGGTLFAISITILIILACILYPKVFQAKLGTVSTPFTQDGAKTKFQKWLFQKKWAPADFYSYLLRYLNVILLILILITMPERPQGNQ